MSTESMAAQRSRGVAELSAFGPPALLCALVFGYLTRNGASTRDVALMCLAVLATQVLPGMALWRCLRPRDGWWVEDVVMGAALGAALVVPNQFVSVVLGQPWLVWIIPLLLVALLAVWPQSRSRIVGAQCSPLPLPWGALSTLACLIPLWSAWRFIDEQKVVWKGWASLYVDLPYHLALAGEVAHRFPPHYPQVAGDVLHYHYFAHTWVANVSTASGAPLDVVLFRFMPAVMAVLLPLATAVVAIRVTKLVWAGPLAAAIAFTFTEISLFSQVRAPLPLTPYSPTQGFGVLMLLLAVNLLALHWRKALSWWGVILLVAVTFIAGGSKGSTLPVLVCGCAVATVAAALFRTGLVKRVAADSLMVLVTLVIIVKLIFNGADGGVRVDLFAAIPQQRGEELTGATEGFSGLATASIIALALLALLLGSIGVLGLLRDKATREDPVAWLLVGSGMGGVGAILVFTHPGSSQWYFFWTAEVPLSIAAAWGCLILLREVPAVIGRITIGAIVGIAAALVARGAFSRLASNGASLADGWLTWAVFAVVVGLGSLAIGWTAGRRGFVAAALAAVTVAGVVPAVNAMSSLSRPSSTEATQKSPGSTHSSQVVAARWIRDHSDPDDIVMTNRHCRAKENPTCDARRFNVAAYSERGVLVEGWAYTQKGNARAAEAGEAGFARPPFWDQELYQLNTSFFTEPDADKAAQLRDLGVRWVFVDETVPHAGSLEPYAVERYQTKFATVYELVP